MVKAKIKASETVSEKTPSVEETPTKKSFHLPLWRVSAWLVFILALSFLWFNPEVIYNSANYLKNSAASDTSNPSINELQKQITDLQDRIYNVGAAVGENTSAISAEEINSLNQRFSNLESQINAIDTSKADNSAVFAIINRLDKIEQRLDTMAKISDQGALILTSDMMIKDAAERGDRYEYEAEILSQLSQKEEALKAPVTTLLNLSNRSIPSAAVLTERFNNIYLDITQNEKEKLIAGKGWKERINIKIKEYVKVTHTKKGANGQASAKDPLDSAAEDINSGQFAPAIAILNSVYQNKLLEYPELKEWVEAAQTRVDFYEALSKISSYSLALMKLNYIKKDTTEQ